MINGCGATLRDASGNSVPVATLFCLFPMIANIISYLLIFSGVVAVIMIIFSGIKLISSSGDPKQVAEARKILIYAVLGLMLIFLSFAIVAFIANTTGVACINPGNTFLTNPFDTCK